MLITEQEIEDILLKNEEIEVNGVSVYIYARQINLGGYYLDALGQDDDGNIYAVEIKKDVIDGKALSQLLNYIKYIKHFNSKTKYKKKIFGVLIGESINDYTSNALEVIENIVFVSYTFNLVFKQENYTWKDSHIKSNIFKNSCTDFNNLTIGEERDDDIIAKLEGEQNG